MSSQKQYPPHLHWDGWPEDPNEEGEEQFEMRFYTDGTQELAVNGEPVWAIRHGAPDEGDLPQPDPAP